jgi:16S rRNA (cytosine967-C5)-methyltransferase
VARHSGADQGEVGGGSRWVAAIVLERVTDKAAYASRALDAELTRARLDPRDAALATEIVYGTLRVLPALDKTIRAQLSHVDARLDGFVHATLRTAAYQLAHLGRLPSYSIVDEAVAQVRAKRGPKLAGFVNAVLRKLANQRPAEPEPPRTMVLPEWVERTLEHSIGPERLARFLAPGGPPALCLRAEAGTRDALLSQLRAALPAAEIEAATLSPLGIAARRAGSPRALPGYSAGAFSVQEEGAQLVALSLGTRPGERIADVCAGHGGKTTLLARRVGPSGHVAAFDRDERKLQVIPAELERLGLPRERVELHAVDLSVGLGGVSELFDRVLVDAPCTGLGTLQRRPELLLRLTPEDPARLAILQLSILERAAALVRPGGVIGYAVCSPASAEGQGVSERFSASHPNFALVHEALEAGMPAPDADGVLRIGAWLASPTANSVPDAYQLVLWRRTA